MGGGTVSTRTRILLKHTLSGVTWRGRNAIIQLISSTGEFLTNRAIKTALAKTGKNSKREKLLALAEKLPPGFELLLYQEPRRTRKNRSLYWSNI